MCCMISIIVLIMTITLTKNIDRYRFLLFHHVYVIMLHFNNWFC